VNIRLDRSHRRVPLILGVVTLAGVVLLLVQDAARQWFPVKSHDTLAAFALAMIAVAYLIYQIAHRPVPMELVKAILLAAAFLFWAANQFWPNLPRAMFFNDVAIALFVLDVFLVIAGWPPAAADSSFAETGVGPCRCGQCCCVGPGRRADCSPDS
jgi:hypothetical protein